MLVPGVLAVVSLTDLVGNETTTALLDLGQVGFTIVSIALGVLVGVACARAIRLPRRGSQPARTVPRPLRAGTNR
jgi:uncharacterized membrane protein YjjB (DUF3815 family)